MTNTVNLKKHLLLIFVTMAMGITAMAQQYYLQDIRQAINRWQSLAGCALGESRGVIAWYGSNGYQYVHLNNNIGNIIKDINAKGWSIDYISLADNGNYAIICNNGNNWYALGPQNFYDALNELVNNGGLKSATIDINNNYFIVGKNGSVRTNADIWLTFYNNEKERLGPARSAWSNGYALVICFENGVNFYGRVPYNIDAELRKLSFTPDLVQFAKCGNFVFSCKDGQSYFRLNDYSKNEAINSYVYNHHLKTTDSKTSSEYITPTPSYPTTNPCGVCNKTGICTSCRGTGISPNHASGITANCGYCGGTGRCATCHGRGYY